MSFYQKTGTAATSSSHRRTWDTTEYHIKANERLAKEQEEAEKKKGGKAKKRSGLNDELKPPPPKKLLQAREGKVDLESKINKQIVINKTSTSADTGGFYCDICDCVLKDSINYLDHMNGKNHQRNMGYTMKVKRSTLDDIREKLAKKKAEKSKEKQKTNEDEEDIKEEEAKLADLKRQKKSHKKKEKHNEDEGEQDQDLLSIMGLSGFGGGRKNN